ncbi:hypothetical protein B0H14DRAFT_3518366 [Mycena olivaceomarginata]|nr:hypothetical protein B0H14DRAFT_3518366 [Mycena olivaceomarginata]
MATEHHKRDVPNNKDAAFKKHSKKPKPSPLLLHYNYGVAALKWWGKVQSTYFQSDARRSSDRCPAGTIRRTHDRSLTTAKLARRANLRGFKAVRAAMKR